jgi:hypothetical protein
MSQAQIDSVHPFWSELTLVSLNKDFLLDLPSEIDNPEKYKSFLEATSTPLKFNIFQNSAVVQLRNIPSEKIVLILQKIANDLAIVHDDRENDFKLVVDMLRVTLIYSEHLMRNEQDYVDKVARKYKREDEYDAGFYEDITDVVMAG